MARRLKLANAISVCHLASGDRWAGAEAQIATLLRALTRRPDVDICAIVLSEGRLAEEIRSTGIDVAVIPQNRNSVFRIYNRAFRFLENRDVQILHSHRYKEDLLAVLLHARLGSPRLVRTQHGSPEICSLKRKLVYAVHQFTSPSVDRVVSVSSQLQDHLRTYLRPEQIAVIPNGVDLEAVRSSLTQHEAKAQLGIPQDSPVIGSIARLDPVKRHDVFLYTAQQVLREVPDAVFVIAGDGKQDGELRQLAHSLAIAGQVIFLGHQENAQDIMRALDILLLTSDHEGLPMVVLEAMAIGAAVVSRNVGGIPEVLRDGLHGVLVESDDPRKLGASCVRVLRDCAFRTRLVSNAREQLVRCYSADKNAADTLRMYRSILGHADGMAEPDILPMVAGEKR